MPGSHRHSSALSWVVRRVVCWSQIQTNGEVVAVGGRIFRGGSGAEGEAGTAAPAQATVLVLDVLYCMRNSPNACGEGYPCRAQKTPADNPTGGESRTD
jgi:hypothetical protein